MKSGDDGPKGLRAVAADGRLIRVFGPEVNHRAASPGP